MAFTGLLVTAGYAGSLTNRDKTMALPGLAIWSESGSLPYTTTKTAPPISDGAGDPVFTVVSDVDAVIAIGTTPSASTSPRYIVKAGIEQTFYCQPGEKLAAVAA